MTIANHTQIPINAATEWGHIVQEFKNEIDPGQTIELPAASFFGWQDLVVLMSTPKTAISHKQDWASDDETNKGGFVYFD